MFADFLHRQADIIQAVEQAVAPERINLEGRSRAIRCAVISPASKSTVKRAFDPCSACSIKASTCSFGSVIGKMPFLKQLL